ncbi:putative clathrin assembly protein [Capsicum chinense]|nr:putative clathrin assembly protein [Capsicum chinense]
MEKLRKAYDKLKDSTKMDDLLFLVFTLKDLDIAIVKATNHVESPPKERHIAKILVATSITSPRADVAYCIHALSRRLSKTRNWIVVIKTLIVIHRVLREGDPSSKEELLHYSQRGQIFQLSNFKDSNHLAWDCSAWVRTYALFLEEKLECFRTLKNDIESDRLSRTSAGISTVHCRTRFLNGKELSEQLPALQQLLYRLTGCQPEGAACYNCLIQYALALGAKTFNQNHSQKLAITVGEAKAINSPQRIITTTGSSFLGSPFRGRYLDSYALDITSPGRTQP